MFCFFLVPIALAVPSRKHPKKPAKKPPKISVIKKEAAPAVLESLPPKSPLFVNASFGVSRWEGLGFFSGLGFGVFPKVGERFGWGLEGQLLLISSGSLFSALAGAWYYLSDPNVYDRFVTVGLLLGAGFPSGASLANHTAPVGMFEISANQRISDYGWFKLWTRAGLVDSKASAQLGLSLLFQLK